MTEHWYGRYVVPFFERRFLCKYTDRDIDEYINGKILAMEKLSKVNMSCHFRCFAQHVNLGSSIDLVVG